MGNRASPRPPEPPEHPPRWQQVIAPPAAKEEARVAEPNLVVRVPEDRLHDAREAAPHFARLPEHAKEDIRDRWRAAEGARGDQILRRRDTTHRWAVEGAGLFFLSVALLQMPTRLGLILAACAGAGIGSVAARVKPAPLVYGLAFSTAYALFGALSGFRNLVYGILSIPIVLCAAMALATTHRIQRFDSTDL
jgi:hypothetical protein